MAAFAEVIGGRLPEINIKFEVLRSSITMTGSWLTQILRSSILRFWSLIRRFASAAIAESEGRMTLRGPEMVFVSFDVSGGGELVTT